MMRTILLDIGAWDLVLDVRGNIAVAGDPYSLAQDAASAIRLFKGELWYNTALGVPYFGRILGRSPSLSDMKAQFVAAALRVPGVVAAQCFLTEITNRGVHGQVQVTDRNGVITAAGF